MKFLNLSRPEGRIAEIQARLGLYYDVGAACNDIPNGLTTIFAWVIEGSRGNMASAFVSAGTPGPLPSGGMLTRDARKPGTKQGTKTGSPATGIPDGPTTVSRMMMLYVYPAYGLTFPGCVRVVFVSRQF